MLGERRGNVTIVATSDLHGYLDDIEKVCTDNRADILVIAGDIEPAHIFVDKKDWFLNDFIALLKRLEMKGVEVVAIEGNHDFWLSKNAYRKSRDIFDDIANLNKQPPFEHYAPTNFHLLRDSGITLKGLVFYGTPWVPIINRKWCYEGTDSENLVRYMAMPFHTDVLITHTPPLIPDAHIDESTEYNKRYWQHFGSKALYDAIMQKMPHINFCGHIHSGDHRQHLIKTPHTDCYCYNVSRINERYSIEYPLRFIKILDGQLIEVSPTCKSPIRRKKK